MTHLLLPGTLEQQGAGGAFDVENDISWHSLWWADSSVNSGYSDTNDVTTLYDSTTNHNLVEKNAAYSPTFDASHASFNSKAVIDYTASSTECAHWNSSAWTDLYLPYTVVCVGRFGNTVSRRMWELHDSGAATDRGELYCGSTTFCVENGVTAASCTGTKDTNVHLWVVQMNTDVSPRVTWEVDGAGTTGWGAVTEPFDEFWLGTRRDGGGQGCEGHVALAGIYAGKLFDDSNYANFESWVSDYYGITMA